MDWRSMAAYRQDRGADFYLTCLRYGHHLWTRGLAGRAILCLDRAMGADLTGAESVLETWPMPYAPMAWLLTHAPGERLVGNPRVHFQHYADRMNEPRREQRRWRAWACWWIARLTRPELPADPKHNVVEPTAAQIRSQLLQHGLPKEADLWENVCSELGRNPLFQRA